MADHVLLGVLSDTHFVNKTEAYDFSQWLLRGAFEDVQAIFHAGDLVNDALDGCFGDLPFYPVRGNMDASHPDLPIKRVVKLENWRIGLIHGWGRPSEVAGHVLREFNPADLDVLIFGHSHTPWLSRVGGTLLFNPGSATDHRGRAHSCSVGLIGLGDEISARHIYLPVKT